MKYKSVLSTVVLLLFGCAGQGLNNATLETLAREGTIDDLATEKHLYRLDYLVNGQPFSFSTYPVEDAGIYLWILANRGTIVSVSTATDRGRSYLPAVERCTLFPYHPELDVAQCLAEFNAEILSRHDENWMAAIQVTDNASTPSGTQSDSGSPVATGLVFAPVIVPATLLAAPLLIGDYLSDQGQRKEFYLALGIEAGLREFIKGLPEDQVSEAEGRGSAYIASGTTTKTPTIAFGFSGSEVTWIQRRPIWSCGGGFMFWNQQCTVGSHDDEHL